MVLAAMMVLLYAEFGVLRQVLLIVGVVPLATLGGLIALHLTGTTLNVASGVGFIALFGVAVHERRHHGGESQSCARAGRSACSRRSWRAPASGCGRC